MSDHGQATVAQTLRENWFWASIFRDHASFIYTSTAPDQDDVYRWAKGFQEAFEKLLQRAASEAQAAGITAPAGAYALAGRPGPDALPLAGLAGKELLAFEGQGEQTARAILEQLGALKRFKQELIQRKLDCKVKLALGPSLLQHMVNEAEEGQRALGHGGALGQLPVPLQALHHHLVWLPDASGHAGLIHGGVDATEQKLLDVSADFKQAFDGMHIESLELYSMLKVAPRMVGALRRLNRDALAQIGLFRAFLTELREHLEDCEILTVSLMPAMADHMLREELYYTEKVMTLE